MLSFFRINDPYRLVGVFLILIIFRLPFWLSDVGITLPELSWILIANRLSDGATMYSEVWDNLSPLSAAVYWLMSIVFNHSFVAEQILSVVLIFIQASIFNTILLNHGALSENTYIPAAVYVVLASLFFDFYSLSPVLLANTFVLMAINNVFGQIEIRAKRDEKLLMTGVYLGIAMLFHFPYFAFGPIILIIFIVFTATVRRRYFLFLFGWILPIILTMLYYYYQDGIGMFWRNYITSWFLFKSKTYLSTTQLLIFTGYVGLFLILALSRIISRARLTNYQSRLNQAVFFIMLLSLSILFMELDRYPYAYLVYIFPTAYFISHFFTLMKKNILAELLFILFIAGTGYINYKSIHDSKNDGIFNMHSYFVDSSKEEKLLEGRKVLYLGDNTGIYQSAVAATPFLNWRLSSEVWENSRSMRNLIIISNSIEQDKPEIIIDPSDLFSPVLLYAPKLEHLYRRDGQRYYLRSSN